MPGLLLRDTGVGALVVADVAVIHVSPLPSSQKFPAQVEQARQLESPFHLLLPLRLEIGPQCVQQLPGVGVPCSSQLLDQGQEPQEQLRIQPTGQGGERIAAGWRRSLRLLAPAGRRTARLGRGRGGALAALFPPVPPERDWASCMICAMASGLERMLFSLSSNSATAGPPPFCTCRYRPFMVLLMRSIKAAPSGLCISWFTMRTISAGLPLAADWAARWRDAPGLRRRASAEGPARPGHSHQRLEHGGVAFQLLDHTGCLFVHSASL